MSPLPLALAAPGNGHNTEPTLSPHPTPVLSASSRYSLFVLHFFCNKIADPSSIGIEVYPAIPEGKGPETVAAMQTADARRRVLILVSKVVNRSGSGALTSAVPGKDDFMDVLDPLCERSHAKIKSFLKALAARGESAPNCTGEEKE